MNVPLRRTALLLFGSGLCALVYQVAWIREFRLIFGASTSASAAVLAIFVGGLGAGSVWLGPRADRHPRPLLFYAQLETLIAIFAALTPLLLWLVRLLYVALGGSVVLGAFGGTLLRLVLSALVLLVPTVMMGGTLPAAARSVETDDDLGRKRTALLYGVNTLGAVTGAAASTFALLEVLGTSRMLWTATIVNLFVAVSARALARAQPEQQPAQAAAAGPSDRPSRFVFGAAAAVGFAFFLMELVWYRMLGPLLGGTVFTFGLILAVALLGIGIGGALYGRVVRNRPTLTGFAMTSVLEAVLLALPFALGDRIAVLALLLRPLGSVGFAGHVVGWSLVAAIVVLPASIMAGIQFPLLIGLCGQARSDVGRHVGLTYAFNTGGAIVGSLAGGFGLIPLLSAPGCWRLCAYLLSAIGIAAATLGLRKRSLVPVIVALPAILLASAPGPTVAWRHGSIGVGRVDYSRIRSPNTLRDWMSQQRHAIRWEKDGVESSVAIHGANGTAFVLNGKIDGNALGDAPTQVMGGVLGAMLLPSPPKKAMVIGLGTGSTAGWLGALPSIERVDVVELERAILHVAELCTPVNHDVLTNPRVKIQIGDAREVLLTTRERYDLVLSEPSNPFRAGVASLFTREYYHAIARRLEPGGVFLQWVQAYEVDGKTVRTVYATLVDVFPHVETWELGQNDLLLVASQKPLGWDSARLRERMALGPYREALLHAWRVTDVEGVLAHFLAQPALAQAIAKQEGDAVNTDDRNWVEFGFARSIGTESHFDLANVRALARLRHEDRLPFSADVDPARIADALLARTADMGAPMAPSAGLSAPQHHRASALYAYQAGDLRTALSEWSAQPLAPSRPDELTVRAETLAEADDEAAQPLIDELRKEHPTEADAILARLHLRRNKVAEAAQTLASAFVRYRSDPWAWRAAMSHALPLADEIARRDATQTTALLQALSQPFAVNAIEDKRELALFAIAKRAPSTINCGLVLPTFEPFVPWRFEFLLWRRDCYRQLGDTRAARADQELETFIAAQPQPFSLGLLPSEDTASSEGH